MPLVIVSTAAVLCGKLQQRCSMLRQVVVLVSAVVLPTAPASARVLCTTHTLHHSTRFHKHTAGVPTVCCTTRQD